MSKIIGQLLKKYDAIEIESALVQLFVEINEIPVNRNLIIKSLLNNQQKNILTIKSELQNRINNFDLYDLANIFELLIPKKDKKINGAFFTPQVITEFITKQIIKEPSQTICDPSCGCGAFLIASAIHLNQKFGKPFLSIIEKNLYGVDIAEYSIKRAKILLSLLALKNNEDKADVNFNLLNKDSLESDWHNLFPKIMKGGGFDIVIGNPPYVKFQDLSRDARKKLYSNWKTLKSGNYNLYFAFFELGISILNNSGVLGYITPNNYFTSLAGIHLREYLVLNKFIDKIIDFNHLKIFEVQTYTCITYLSKVKKEFFLYERIYDYNSLNNLGRLKYSKIFFNELNNKKWRLLREIDQQNIKRIESAENRLGDIVDIRVGIATCKDSVYFIDGAIFKNGYYQKKYKDHNYLIEKEITKPIVKISDFKNQRELEQNQRRIIFPYKKIDGKVEIITENELSKKFPKCYKYLLAAKEELATRDKGKVQYSQWFAYARTQGLNFFGEKLLTPTFSSKPRFLFEKNPETLFCNGYAIFLKGEPDLFSNSKSWNFTILAKILNSKVMNYYMEMTSVSIEGGYPCYQKNFIELFRIPNFTKEELHFLEKEGNKEKIDSFLIKKYQIEIQSKRFLPNLSE